MTWLLAAFLGLAVEAPEPVPPLPEQLPALWNCEVVGVGFVVGAPCQPATLILYCHEPDRLFVEHYLPMTLNGETVCLPARREELSPNE